ncbi:hypothetical protein Tco_0285609 [Tanacetum coccineum]
MFRKEYIRIESSTQHSSVNEFVVINIPEEDVEPKQIILDPDDQPMWENAKIVAPTPNSAIVQPNVDDNFVINSTHLKMILENKFDGYLRADPHDHIREFLAICDMFKYGKTQSEVDLLETSFEHFVLFLESEISRVPQEVYVSTPITINEKGVSTPKSREIGGSTVKTSAGYNWRNSKPNSNYDSGPTFIKTVNAKVHPLKNMVDRGIFNSGCSGHMTDFEGFLVGYSLNSKAYRVYNLVTIRVEVNLHVNFLEDKPNIKGVGYRWMFDIDYLTDSMNYIPVSLENQANPHAGASEVTNSVGTSQTPNSNASEEKDEDAELIVVPSAIKNTEEKVESRKSSTNSKKEEILTEPQQEKEASSTDTSKDNLKILAF